MAKILDKIMLPITLCEPVLGKDLKEKLKLIVGQYYFEEKLESTGQPTIGARLPILGDNVLMTISVGDSPINHNIIDTVHYDKVWVLSTRPNGVEEQDFIKSVNDTFVDVFSHLQEARNRFERKLFYAN